MTSRHPFRWLALIVGALLIIETIPALHVAAMPALQQATATATPTATSGTATPTATSGSTTPTATSGTATPTSSAGTTTPTGISGTATPTGTPGTATPVGTVTATPTGTPSTGPTSVTLANGYRITFVSVVQVSGNSIWTYRVEQLPGARNLTHWVLELDGCVVVEATPEPNQIVNPDPNAGFNGVRWVTGGRFTNGLFTVTLAGTVQQGLTTVAAKGPDVAFGTVTGPVCTGSGPVEPAPTVTEVTEAYRITLISAAKQGKRVTWTYRMEEIGSAAALQHWELALGGCAVVTATPTPYQTVNPDPDSGLRGIRWDVPPTFTSGLFTVTVEGKVRKGLVGVAATGTGTGVAAITGPVCVRENDDRDDHRGDDHDDNDEPPAVIVVNPGEQAPPTVEVIDGVTYVACVIVIQNTGGDARNVRVTIDLDSALTLVDVTFLESSGYVISIQGQQLVIGVGPNNFVNRGDRVSFRLRTRAAVRSTTITTSIRYVTSYRDSDGTQTTAPVIIPVEIPAVIVAPVVITVPRLRIDQIDGRFRVRWNQRNGLRFYGYPISTAITLRSGIIVQYFERARFEYHPEAAGTPAEIQLGLLGVELGYAQAPLPPPSTPNSAYIPVTGHTIAADFVTFWRDNGGVALFGYPIGEVQVDQDGRRIQCFERAHMELPAGATANATTIQLGLLGEEAVIAQGGEVRRD